MGGTSSLLLLLWVGVTVSTLMDLQKRIIGGRDCDKTDHLYHVKLVDENNLTMCGGSLISDRDMWAVLGVHPGKGEKVEIATRPEMYGDKNNMLHDIMLLQLPKSVTNQTVNLPDCKNRRKIKEFQIAGHGATIAGPLGEHIPGEVARLKCANIPVVKCDTSVSNSRPYEHTFCGETTKVDIADGDSGGGVVYNGEVYGVIIYSGERANTEPAEFMDVCADEYKDWIEKITKKTFPKK